MALTLLILLLSAGLTVIIIPFARAMSLRMGMMNDTVSAFRTQENIPLLGGLPLLFTLVTMVIVSIKLSGELELSESGILLIILLGGFLIFLVGLLYDQKVISPWIALLGQVIVAVILIFSEINFIHENQIISYGLSIVYLLGAINAFKLLDDTDGLAVGIGGIAAFFFGVIFYLNGDLFGLLMASIVVGSTMVLIYYNFIPTRVVLGSNGTSLLGLLIGIMAIMVAREQLTIQTFTVPLIILVIPILSTFFVIIQSLMKRQSIFTRTNRHISNVLINKGLTLNQTLMLFYGLGIVSGIIAVLTFQSLI